MEQIAFGVFPPDWECPFSHDPGDLPDLVNVLIGVGTKLGTRMTQGKSTDHKENGPGAGTVVQCGDPRLDPISPLFNNGGSTKPLLLHYKKETKLYPLTPAAHHLIPAQESMKKSKNLLKWISDDSGESLVKKGKSGSEPVVGKLPAGKAIGYDINGAENGIWLPGPYALKGYWSSLAGRTATADVDTSGSRKRLFSSLSGLSPSPSSDPVGEDVEDEDVTGGGTVELDDDLEPQLDVGGQTIQVNDTAQVIYAIEAIQLAGAQFHDRHVDYSKVVEGSLGKINSKIETASLAAFCQECADLKDDPNYPYPLPPYKLARRFNDMGTRLSDKLTGTTPDQWHPALYTSNRVCKFRAHFEAPRRKRAKTS